MRISPISVAGSNQRQNRSNINEVSLNSISLPKGSFSPNFKSYMFTKYIWELNEKELREFAKTIHKADDYIIEHCCGWGESFHEQFLNIALTKGAVRRRNMAKKLSGMANEVRNHMQSLKLQLEKLNENYFSNVSKIEKLKNELKHLEEIGHDGYKSDGVGGDVAEHGTWAV